jgi:NAD(P)-dependent dehydrogenase (short-subunit alcohol dehydrogenase family)
MYKEKFDLSDKVAILTGGTGLIGTAFAEGLAEYGCHVVICDLNQEKSQELSARITKKSGTICLGIATDVTKRKDIEDMVIQTLDRFNKIDILINNHQYKPLNFFKSFEHYSENDWDDIVSVNLKGTYLCCQIVGKQMLKQGYGTMINIASVYGVVSPNQEIYQGTGMGCPAAYVASKGGVISLTQYLATYWAEKNIRVNAISPHGVYNVHEKKFIENFSKKSPLRRMSTREEVVSALIFLASDASSYVTGHNLIIDGGWTVW